MDCLNVEEDFHLYNISGVDYKGLLDDIGMSKENDSQDS